MISNSMYYGGFDYGQVDKKMGSTPKKRDIRVPSLASIEDMRTPFYRISKGENEIIEIRQRPDNMGTKVQELHQEALSPLRTPFAHIN